MWWLSTLIFDCAKGTCLYVAESKYRVLPKLIRLGSWHVGNTSPLVRTTSSLSIIIDLNNCVSVSSRLNKEAKLTSPIAIENKTKYILSSNKWPEFFCLGSLGTFQSNIYEVIDLSSIPRPRSTAIRITFWSK